MRYGPGKVGGALIGAAFLSAPALMSLAPSASVITRSAAVQNLHRVHNVQKSSNWSGYAETSSVPGAYSAVTGEWLVPAAGKSSGRSFEASWIGIDGDGNSNLIQTGTSTQYAGGTATYYAWWEILPAAETQIAAIAVAPGDTMTASVSHGSGADWTITITDLTTNQSFTTTQTYSGAGESAEWIVERPQVGLRLSTLNDYGTEIFGNMTLDGDSPDLVPADDIDMTDDAGAVISTPSAPDPAANGFNTAYGSKAPSPAK